MTLNKTGKKKFRLGLGWQILIALFLGIILGAILHNNTEYKDWLILNILNPAGNIFIQLIK